MSATVTIPAGITVIVDGDGRHDLVPGTYPVHATTATGQQVPAGDRPHFLEVDLPTAGTTGIGVILLRISAYEDRFPVQTVDGRHPSGAREQCREIRPTSLLIDVDFSPIHDD